MIWIEGAFQRPHHVEAGLTGESFQKFLLRETDAVLAGNRAAELNCFLEYLAEGSVDALDFVLVALVAEEGRMQVAVAEVAEDANLQPVLLGSLLDERNHSGQLAARDGGVFQNCRWRDA